MNPSHDAGLTALRALRTAASVLLLLTLACPHASAAQDPARAKQLYNEARDLKEAGDIRGSLEKLQQAYEAFPSDAILVSIANRHLDLGEPEEAGAVLSRIQPTSANVRKEVRRLRADVEARLAEPVAVRLSSDAPDAEVAIDGGPYRPLPAKVQLPRGSHTFVVRAPHREPETITQELRGSIEVPIIASLRSQSGQWRVATEPQVTLDKVRVLIEGQTVAMTGEERQKPVSDPRAVPPGNYHVTCLKGFEARADAEVVVVAGEVAVATCTFVEPPKAHKLRPWAWASAGGAAAGIGVGTWALISYLQEKKDYPSDRYELNSSKPAVAGISYGVGAALGVLSAILFTRD
ncbi:MAG: hypothetical protein H6744_15790 [Deltaproteobacteria bacterium]|nr:hypothetical protein [Deltaproteobacteria bacterium]MCB9788144.1 hypothetical protein [Deltaproteobacteria bacterium]